MEKFPAFMFSLLLSIYIRGADGSIGVNYGTEADNLPSPEHVAHFLLESTIINRVRLFDANPEMLKAFAQTGIGIIVTLPNDQIPHFTKLNYAQEWVKAYIVPHFPATNIVRILVGNEVLSTANKMLIVNLVPAMQTLHAVLVGESMDRWIQISTPHSLGILANSSPPSTGKFREGYDSHVLKPLLSFLKATNSPFMVNPYPFFGSSADILDYALFRPNAGVLDESTKLTYANMLDAQLDAVFSAMKLLGFTDVDIVIAETGWPSKGGTGQAGVDAESAAEYNRKLMQHVTSGIGTPLMPNRTFETYIFALFNEDLKPGPTCERNFGLFQPNLTPVYNIGILRPTVAAAAKNQHTVKANFPSYPTPAVKPTPEPKGKTWFVPESGANEETMQRNIDCVWGLDMEYCKPIQESGACFYPNTVRAHAAYAMNAYYQASMKNDFDCDFRQTGAITKKEPSSGNCKYLHED